MKVAPVFASCLAALAVLAFVSAAAGHSYRLGAVSVGHIWAPPLSDGADDAPVYGVIVNKGASDVRLVGASTPAARAVSLRGRPNADGKVLKDIVLKPGRPLALATWGPVLWLEGVNRPLTNGEMVPLTLDFGPDGKIDIEIAIEDGSSH